MRALAQWARVPGEHAQSGQSLCVYCETRVAVGGEGTGWRCRSPGPWQLR